METAMDTVDDIYNDLQNICDRLEKVGHHCVILWTGSQFVLGTSFGVTFLSQEPELNGKFHKYCQGFTDQPKLTWKETERVEPEDNFNNTLKQAFELLNDQEEIGTPTEDDNGHGKYDKHLDGHGILDNGSDDRGIFDTGSNDRRMLDERSDEYGGLGNVEDIHVTLDKGQNDEEEFTRIPETETNRVTDIKKTATTIVDEGSFIEKEEMLSKDEHVQSTNEIHSQFEVSCSEGPGMRTRNFAQRRPVLDGQEKFTLKPQLKKSIIKIKRLRQSDSEQQPTKASNASKTNKKIQDIVEDEPSEQQTIPDKAIVVQHGMYNGMEVVAPEMAITSDTMVCFKCYKIYESLAKLKEHMTKQHHVKLGHLCQCGRFFSNKNDLEHHRNSVKHKHCTYCSKICENESKLKLHVEDAHGVNLDDIKNQYRCEQCGSTFMFKQFLEMHYRKLPNCVDIIDKSNTTGDTDITYTNEEGQIVTHTLAQVLASQNKAPYNCVVCTITKKNKIELKQHILKTHMSEKKFLCVICGIQIKSRASLITHKKSHILKPFNCWDCRARYETEEELTMHQDQECRGGDLENLKCEICNYKATSRSALDSHRQVHTGLRPFSCSLCGKGMATKASLERHMQAMHGDKYNYKCAECEKTFKTKDTYRRHLKVHKNPGYKCEICGKTCTERGNLNKHMRTHTGEKPFVCEICGAKYGRKAMLQVHIRAHTGETPYTCETQGCGKQFRSYALLKQHKVIHNSSYLYVCDVCGKAFKHVGRLNYHKKGHYTEYPYPCAYCPLKHKTMFIYKGHLAKHHPEKRMELEQRFNIKLYQCHLCPKVYGVKDDLARHIYIHLGYKPFKCQFCGKSFNDKSNLTAHEKNHTTKREFVCQICIKAFKHYKTLRLHHKTFHKGRPFPVNRNNETVCKAEKVTYEGNVVRIEVVKPERVDDHTYQFASNVIIEEGKTADLWRDRVNMDVHTLEPVQGRVPAESNHSLLEPLMIVENF